MLDVSRETLEALETYAALVLKWTQRINLISAKSKDDIWHRHIMDSIRVADAAPEKVETWEDLGSGGGLPAIVVALVLRDRGRLPQMSLIESDSRKCAFLREARRTLDLDITINENRIENAVPTNPDVISARALAPLDKLLSLAHPRARQNTVFLFPKGESYEMELTEAASHWTMDVDVIDSPNPGSGPILRLTGVLPRS